MPDTILALRELLYEPLANSSNAIRLVLLRPRSYQPSCGTATDAVYCELINVIRGDNCPTYTALSYAWGNNPALSSLVVDQQAYEVSLNVGQVLRQLRHAREDSYIWVDQICIDQENDSEKTHQVQQMRHIYNEAQLVVAWLGPTANGSDLLLKHIERMGDAVWADDERSIVAAHQNEEGRKLIARAFRHFCERKYWQRLWVIQEFTVGNKLCIACGDVLLRDWNLLALLVFLNKAKDGDLLSEVVEENICRAIVQTYDTPTRSFMEGIVTRRTRYATEDAKEENSLFSVLVSTLVLENDYNFPQATDPRDRVYAVLNLAEDAADFQALPSYHLSCEEVYREVALGILRQGNIDILSYCQFP